MQADFYHYIYINIHMQRFTCWVINQRFFWQSICFSLMTHGLYGFWNALFHSHRFDSYGWPVGFSFLLENAYSRLYWSLINELLLLFVCLLGFAMFLHIWCVLRFEGLDSKECTLPGFDGGPPDHSHHCYCQKAMLLREGLPQRWLWRRRGGHPHSLTSWNNTSCCG